LIATQNAAKSLAVKLQVFEIRGRDDLAKAFQAARKGRAEALNVFASPLLSSLQQSIRDLAASHRLPAIYQWREHAEEGGLVSYGPSLLELWRQTAVVVGRILKGAKPGDLPIEQPTKFELVINLKTAKALGLTIPQSLRGSPPGRAGTRAEGYGRSTHPREGGATMAKLLVFLGTDLR
jgi:putative ABC transport system substrate-binding protein